MTTPEIVCREDRRREDVRKTELFGLDFVEVDAAQTTLEVFFLGKAPPKIARENVSLTGGQAVRVVSISMHRQRDPGLDDWMEVFVDRPGDFSPYAFALVQVDERGRPTGAPMDGFDPRFSSVTFGFKVSCPTDLDCYAPQICPPPARVQPDINYLAKDYGSFRQLILDRLAQTMPDWKETHVPDVGVMLVEVLAYVGDQLSYYQDAVATEAYLGTARRRISVRRHARLVDYAMHEGCNARAWLTIDTDTDADLDPAKIFFCTPFPGAPAGGVMQFGDFLKAPPGSCEIFEPLVADPKRPIALRKAHGEIPFYTWGDCACCLPRGATRATLLDAWLPRAVPKPSADDPAKTPTDDSAKTAADDPAKPPRERALALAVNDVLIFEEVIGPGTGNRADADPLHRQAVRLTKVTPGVDMLYDTDDGGRPVVDIEWCSEDALTFPLCISARMPAPDCTCRDGLSVARGNVILVDSGATVTQTLDPVPTASTAVNCATDCEPASITLTPETFRPPLEHAPLTFGQDLPPCGCASIVIANDPRQALPRIMLTGTLDTPHGPVTTRWTARADLLESEPDDASFVAEIDDDGRAHLRFGNGDEGRIPDAGTTFEASYRVGNGPEGNVGAETITYLVLRDVTTGIGKPVPRNPLPAAGGTAPERVDEVRMFAPYAFRDVLERAITADDYATLSADNARRLAERARLLPAAPSSTAQIPIASAARLDDARAALEEEPGEPQPLPDICLIPFKRLQNAKGTLRWTGSWYEAQVALDPLGTEACDDELTAEIAAFLEPYRRIGHDLGVQAARYVPLDLGVSVCVAPGYFRGDVDAALIGALGNGVLPDGTTGIFNPDNLTFGQGVRVSPIVAAVQAVPGVMEVQVTRLARYVLGTPPAGATADSVPASGVLRLGAFEIARLDNDPNAPANGRLTVIMRGGR
jgi:hypothetical protein